MSLSELLLYGLIVVGVIVFNYITQQVAQKRRREEARREAEQRAEAMAPVDEADDYAWGRRPTSTVPARIEEAAPYEWGRRPEAIAVPPAEYSGDERRTGEPALSREELQAREARARMEAKRQPRTLRRTVEARRLFATREDLHRAVIAMTVLGPCRAIEPPASPDAGRPIARAH